jgi:peptidoglycan hydrolase-like protein with peptidoglycan-binding domain
VKKIHYGLIIGFLSLVVVIGAAVPAGATTSSPYLRIGSRGYGVSCVQEILNVTTGGSNLDVDGQFGPLTSGKVKTFQGMQGLTKDGVVGPMTGRALISQAKESGVYHTVVFRASDGAGHFTRMYISSCYNYLPV